MSAAKPFSAGDLASAAVVVVIWGLNCVVVKVGLRDFTPFQLGAARFFFAFFPLVFWFRPPRIGVGPLVAYGLLQGVGQFGCLFLALKVGMSAALAPVMMQTQVFGTAVLAALLLGERLGRPLLVGLALAAGGLACFAANAWFAGGAGVVTLAGLALNLMAAIHWAGSNILVRHLQMRGVRYDALSLLVWSGGVSAVGFALLSVAVDPPGAHAAWTNASLAGWATVAYLAWGANLLGYWLWTRLLSRHPASRVSPLSLGMPLLGIAAGILLLGEVVTEWQWAGAAMVMAAMGCVVRGEARAR
ncbi:MAG: EamA family transporter [Acidimicrobiia bacterium]